MKRFIIFLPLLVLFVSLLQGQQPTHNLKINPLSPLTRTYEVAYEYSAATHFSLQLSGGWVYYNPELWDGLGGKVRGYQLSPEFRYFLGQILGSNQEAPFGFYVGGWFQYQQLSGELSGYVNEGNKAEFISREFLNMESYAGGLSLGHQFPLKWKGNEYGSLDIFAGLGYQSADMGATLFANEETIPLARKGLAPRIGIWLGFPF